MNLKNTGDAASVEIVHAIRQAGLNPDEAQLNQLSQAISLIVSRDSISEERIRELIREDKTPSYELCEFYFFRNPALREGFRIANGDIVVNAAALYPEAWSFLQTTTGKSMCLTEEAWQAMSTASFATLADGTQIGWEGIGGVPYFSLDLHTGSLRLPDVRGMYAEAAGFDSLDVGGVHGDGIRNFTGEITCNDQPLASGSFYRSVTAVVNNRATGISTDDRVVLDPSRVVPVANKNQPRAWGALPCVYLGGRPNLITVKA